jgi:hypothetical protein
MTLARLRDDRPFKVTVAALRAEGWKDWHILTAIANAAMNYRGRLRAMNDIEGMQRAIRELWGRSENAVDPEVPMSSFSVSELREHLSASMPATLTGFGLSMPPGPYSQPEVDRVLHERYRYWNFDVPHDDPFVQPLPSRTRTTAPKKGRCPNRR